jgi:hypothetical protein
MRYDSEGCVCGFTKFSSLSLVLIDVFDSPIEPKLILEQILFCVSSLD